MYAVGAIIAVALILGGYGYVNHLQTQVADLKRDLGNQRVETEILKQKQKTFENFISAQTKIQKRVENEEKQIDESVATVDAAGLSDLYGSYRVRGKGSLHSAADARTGSSKH